MKTKARKKSPPLHIRWLIRRDMTEVLMIERMSFDRPWEENDFIRSLRQRNCIGMVAEGADERVAGFFIYELHKERLHILNFAVHEQYRLKGVGRQMVDKLKSKLSRSTRNRILVEVRESNLDAQLFFKSQGFVCKSTMRNFYSVTDEDAYSFIYRLGW